MFIERVPKNKLTDSRFFHAKIAQIVSSKIYDFATIFSDPIVIVRYSRCPSFVRWEICFVNTLSCVEIVVKGTTFGKIINLKDIWTMNLKPFHLLSVSSFLSPTHMASPTSRSWKKKCWVKLSLSIRLFTVKRFNFHLRAEKIILFFRNNIREVTTSILACTFSSSPGLIVFEFVFR